LSFEIVRSVEAAGDRSLRGFDQSLNRRKKVKVIFHSESLCLRHHSHTLLFVFHLNDHPGFCLRLSRTGVERFGETFLRYSGRARKELKEEAEGCASGW
jgi:hypothetical protein